VVRRTVGKVLGGIVERNIERLIVEYYRCERPGEGPGGRTGKKDFEGDQDWI
jgi:hypothetical protein